MTLVFGTVRHGQIPRARVAGDRRSAVGPTHERSRFAADTRLDPRVRRVLPILSSPKPTRDATDRDEALARANTPEAIKAYELATAASDRVDRESVAPSAGLVMRELEFTSQPDGNTVKINFIRPEGDDVIPAVYYIHGGGMMNNSAFDGNYRAWGKLLAARGLAVAMVDFRNSLVASSSGEVAPYPAGLNDCVSGLRWCRPTPPSWASTPTASSSRVTAAAAISPSPPAPTRRRRRCRHRLGHLCILPVHRRTLAAGRAAVEQRERGLLHPDAQQHRARWRTASRPLEAEDPQAWPLFASTDDLDGFPPTIISVNECDPLRDEGIAFYRKLLAAKVPARCRQIMGTMHAVELIPNVCPDISRDAARDVAGFAYEG